MTGTNDALAKLAVQYWKLCGAFEREIAFADPVRADAAAAQLRFARSRLDTILSGEGLRVETFDGAAWSADIPASAVNADEIEANSAATIAETIEPTIVDPGGVVHQGKILLKQA